MCGVAFTRGIPSPQRGRNCPCTEASASQSAVRLFLKSVRGGFGRGEAMRAEPQRTPEPAPPLWCLGPSKHALAGAEEEEEEEHPVPLIEESHRLSADSAVDPSSALSCFFLNIFWTY